MNRGKYLAANKKHNPGSFLPNAGISSLLFANDSPHTATTVEYAGREQDHA